MESLNRPDITIPFLESNLSLKDYSKSLKKSNVSHFIHHDLKIIMNTFMKYDKVYFGNNVFPYNLRHRNEKDLWLKHVTYYNELLNYNEFLKDSKVIEVTPKPEFYRLLFNEDQQIFNSERIDFSDKYWYENMKNYNPKERWVVIFDLITLEQLDDFNTTVLEKKYKDHLETPYARRLALHFKITKEQQAVILAHPYNY